MAPRSIRITVEDVDKIRGRFANQLAAVGEGKARVAMARAVNHATRKTYTSVRRALVRQTSAPRALVNSAVKMRLAAHKGAGAIEAMIYASGSELPLNLFKPRQFSYGVRAKVWGKNQRFPGMFGAPGDNPKVIAALGGHIFHRISTSRTPIEKTYGPSLPKEMLLDATREAFEKDSARFVEERLAHELSRMLPG